VASPLAAVMQRRKLAWVVLLTSCIAAVVLALALFLPRRRHCSLRLPVFIRLRVVDARSGSPVPMAEIFVVQSSTLDVGDPDWRRSERTAHMEQAYETLGLSGYGVTGSSGAAVVLFYGRTTMTVLGECPPGDWMPSGCLATRLWVCNEDSQPAVIDLGGARCDWYTGASGRRVGIADVGTVALERR
jgi:hypothetical protein